VFAVVTQVRVPIRLRLDMLRAANRLRKDRNDVVVEPASLNVLGWSQADYLALWEAFIERHVRLLILMPGWEYSAGCVTELACAYENRIVAQTLSGDDLCYKVALAKLKESYKDLQNYLSYAGIAQLARSIDLAAARIETMLLSDSR
jgi:hypothetical protein